MKAIVIVDNNWAIGCDGKLLVHLPEDLKYFKEKTLGKVVVMGRETLESLPGKRPLPNRENFVLTGNDCYETSCNICLSLDEAISQLSKFNSDDIFVIGGQQIYNQFLPLCDEAFVTKVNSEFHADKFFPNLDEMPDWKLTEETKNHEYEGIEYKFTKYIRT